jgi:nucleotide-binding universal stress UspA family protein
MIDQNQGDVACFHRIVLRYRAADGPARLKKHVQQHPARRGRLRSLATCRAPRHKSCELPQSSGRRPDGYDPIVHRLCARAGGCRAGGCRPHREYDAKREAATARILHQVVSEAHAAGVRARPLHRCHHDPYRAIVATALHEACDLIVIGSPCRSIGGAVLGGEAMRILNHTTVPVLVCRGS